MLFKKNYYQVLSRLSEFYSGGGKDMICAKMNIPNPFIDEYRKTNNDGETNYPNMESRAIFWENVLSVYRDLEDDSVPSCYLSELDEGLYGGLLGSEIRFMSDTSTGWVSSMAVPCIEDIKEIRSLTINENNIWFKRYKKQLEVFLQISGGKFGISHFIMVNGLNLLFELRGATNTYYDILENPEQARYAMDFSHELNLWVQETYFNCVGLYDGGTCSNIGQWIPGRIISESLDPFHLTSVDMFEQWGKRQIERAISHFDGGVIHIHSNGHHLLESASTIKDLKCIYLLDEEFNPPVYLQLDKILSKTGFISLVINMPFEVFSNKLVKKELPSNVFYNVTGVPDIKTANILMNDIRNYK